MVNLYEEGKVNNCFKLYISICLILFLDKEPPHADVDLQAEAENGLNYIYDRMLYWIRKSGPPAPSCLPAYKDTLLSQTRKELAQGKVKGDDPKPDADDKPKKRHMKLKETRHNDMYNNAGEPVNNKENYMWNRYLEKKKMEKIKERKASKRVFLPLLQGQRVELRDCSEKSTTSPRNNTKPAGQQGKQNKKRTKQTRTDRLRTSDEDTDTNISFEFSSNVPVDEPMETSPSAPVLEEFPPSLDMVKEEVTSPARRPPPPRRLWKYMKQDKLSQETRDAVRRESIHSYLSKEMEAVEFGKSRLIGIQQNTVEY
jgi:hypothetical protein